MLFSKKKGLSIDTLIGLGATIEGDVTFSGGFVSMVGCVAT